MVLFLTRQVLFLIPLFADPAMRWGMDGILFSGPVADFAAFVTTVLLVRHEMKHIRALEEVQKA